MTAGRRALRILLIGSADIGGGAELSAWNLFNTYRNRGHKTRLVVGCKRTGDPDVVALRNDSSRNSWARFWMRAGNQLEPFGHQVHQRRSLRDLTNWIGEPVRWFDIARGHEDFHYPATSQLLRSSFDIVHCYNLHGGYFDLRVLPSVSRRQPVILDLRDAWLLSGHCAHSLGCDRWKSGCGHCPDLRIYPSIRRDGTAFNWRRKQRIFSSSQLYVATPSRWMMQMVGESMLGPSVLESRVVPTGVDLSVFRPSAKEHSRAQLNIPLDARVLLFVANGVRRNMWKDYRMLSSACTQLFERHAGQKLLLIALGDKASVDVDSDAQIRFIPHVNNAEEVARYYQAADVYVHAAVADTFPRAVLEALACGTPVVATGVGGIPEQIRNLDDVSEADPDRATGIVVPPGDAKAMTEAIERLLTDEPLRRRLGENAAVDARDRFDLEKQADRYLAWYEALMRNRDPLNDQVKRDPTRSTIVGDAADPMLESAVWSKP